MEKKKNADFIIPASYFKNKPKATNGQAISVPAQEAPTKKVEETISTLTKETAVPTPEPQPEKELVSEPKSNYEPKKIQLKGTEKRVSGLSLSSIKVKKAHVNTKIVDIDEANLPKNPFEESEMQKHWDDRVHLLENQGRKILASNFQTDVPKLKNENTIWIELPNNTMKKEIEREQSLMMDYLKEKLNNYSISLFITVNEEVAKKFAFTPAEKYEKLREKNPNIDLLRKEFDLDF